MNLIEIGDEVIVRFFEIEPDYKGIVKHIPNNVGDLWYIECSKDIIAINPNCNILIGIFKTKT